MKRGLRIAIFLVLAASAGFFSWRFKLNYDRLMAAGANLADTDLINVRLPDYQKKAMPLPTDYHLGEWGLGLVLSLIGAGFLLAQELSQFYAGRIMKMLYNEEGEEIVTPDYEKAEEEWSRGNYLEAICMMREYLEKNPREQHVALRIAEIYEKDLLNPLAAALEYEEVLKQKLPAERWGWAAIHLCNLYSGKLNQPDKAVALLRRLDTEYGKTVAARKARARLAQLAAEGMIGPVEQAALPAQEEPPGPGLPPGFAPKKG